MDNTEFASLKTDIEKSLQKIEGDGSGVRLAIKKLEDQFTTLNKEMDTRRLETKTHPLFGNQRVAEEFVNVLRGAVAQNPAVAGRLTKESPLHISKADLNTYGTGTGIEVVPTATSDVLSILLAQGGVARQECTVLSGLHDKVVLTKRNGTSTAAFTSATTLKDDVAVTPVAPGTAAVTLSPSQVVALAAVSEKLLYMSAVNIAEFVAMDMVEQAGVLEDNSLIKGDGTVTYGNITGIQTASGVVESTVAFGSFDLSDVIKLPGTVAEAAQNSPNAKYYISGKVMSILRSQKGSTSGLFYMDPTTGGLKLAGYDVKIWHRMDNTVATNKFPVFFGDLRKACVMGIGRDMGIQVDHSVKFLNSQAVFRLCYDFDIQTLQGTAMARLKTLIS